MSNLDNPKWEEYRSDPANWTVPFSVWLRRQEGK